MAAAAWPPVLAGEFGAAQPPIRAELFGALRFEQHGRSLAATHTAEQAVLGARTFFPRLKDNIAMLRMAHGVISAPSGAGTDISPAAEWLLDNFHLIELQLKEVHDGLPRSYFRRLPVLRDAPLAGLPRVYGLAWAFVAHCDGAFDDDLLVRFLCAYQEVRELELGEMWALPTTLRVVLVENLRRLAERLALAQAAEELANRVCDQGQPLDASELDGLLARLRLRGADMTLLAHLASRLRDPQVRVDPQVRHWLQRALPDAATTQAQHSAEQAADNLSVSNAVTSLRAITNADWPDIVSRASALMRLMLTAPSFAAEHTTTRDQTLHGIERLARRSSRKELRVAQVLLQQMHGHESASPDGSARPIESAQHAVAGHWLSGPGQGALLDALKVPATSRLRAALVWRATARRLALPAYLGVLALGTFALAHWQWPHDASGALPWRWLAAALLLFPASETVCAVLHRLVSESARPTPLPRLALVDGIGPEQRTMVVIPAMLTDLAAIDGLAHRLLLHHLANPERHVQFALLTDGPDAPQQQMPQDAALLAHAQQAIGALNEQFGAAAGDPLRFLLLHRERTYSTSEQAWIGWERKRGKLEQLVAALATGSSGAFVPAPMGLAIAPGTHYLLTLDSDTQLPPGRLRELVGAASHPTNQPVLDAACRRVVQGFGILQPRLSAPLAARTEITRFHALFAGQGGIDPYSTATSEVHQDLFGEGSFTGKGLLQVQAVHAVLGSQLPESQVLSHDLLEGSLARCATVTDIDLIEEAPFHADVAASRMDRWTRGDWQLLPLLLQPRRYALRGIHRWKMLDNLRRSLVAPAASQRMALDAVQTQLVDDDAGLIRLLHPPLARAQPSAGYIQAYPPGVRENGGQYSHAAVWAVMAEAQFAHTLGESRQAAFDRAFQHFTWLSPAHRAAHPTQGPVYGAEPYAMAGDVYSHAPYAGRAGWSWYTGAAAWLHRCAIESLFGLHMDAQQLRLQPCLPSHWPGARLVLRRPGCELHFEFVRGAFNSPHPVLLPGAVLAWPQCAVPATFIVPLDAASAAP